MRAATRLTGPLFLISTYYAALPLLVWLIDRWLPQVASAMPFGGIAELFSRRVDDNLSIPWGAAAAAGVAALLFG